MIYNCVRCGYETNHKGHFLNHLHRKKICRPILEDISIEDIKNHYDLENAKIHQNNPYEPKKTTYEPKKTQNNSFNCNYCNKIFKRNWHLSRHLSTCKIKKMELNRQKEEIDLLKLQQKKLEETVEKLLIECSNNNKKTSNKTINNKTTNNNNSNNTNTNSNNTIHNTININNYGEENTKYITKQFIVDLLKNKPFKAIPEMIKHTHFNEEHPENQNIKITNKKEPYVKIMKDNKWELQDRKNTITDLIDKQHIKMSDEKVEKKIDRQCSSQEKMNIERCNELYNEDEGDYMKRLYNESELVMLNNS
jgi:hypothetical protein